MIHDDFLTHIEELHAVIKATPEASRDSKDSQFSMDKLFEIGKYVYAEMLMIATDRDLTKQEADTVLELYATLRKMMLTEKTWLAAHLKFEAMTAGAAH